MKFEKSEMKKEKKEMKNEWMKRDKALAPLRRVINQKNFDISKTVEELKDVSPKGLIAFSNDLEEIKQFLNAVHERAIKEMVDGMKNRA
ncbi:hypothetical protein [Mesoaciditoga lauensis]|uniref:hypothetical protein n=1 Tax=Mesoaciditoga lauensis TaxID=1495039 RepID=UPI0012E06EFB|nr:hypothetical protein [Mesoaciditoga lauensis]